MNESQWLKSSYRKSSQWQYWVLKFSMVLDGEECECGSEILKSSLSKHKKVKKHLLYMNNWKKKLNLQKFISWKL
jgi:hypothetical protein